MDYAKRPVLGLTEKITIVGRKGRKKLTARIDSGATNSSIHDKLAKELGLGPSIGKKLVKSTNGQSVRPLVKGKIIIDKKRITTDFTVADRNHLRYKVLIGQNVLKTRGFFIDPLK